MVEAKYSSALAHNLEGSSINQIFHTHRYSQRLTQCHKSMRPQKSPATSQKSGRTGRAAMPGAHTSHCSPRSFSGPQRPLLSYKAEPFSLRTMTPEKETAFIKLTGQKTSSATISTQVNSYPTDYHGQKKPGFYL